MPSKSETYRNKKLTPRQKLIRRKYTKRDKDNRVWLVVDHQSFKLEFIDVPDERKHDKDNAEWRRYNMAIALDRMIDQQGKPAPKSLTCGYCENWRGLLPL